MFAAPLNEAAYALLIDLALSEDLGAQEPDAAADLTAAWTVPPGTRARAVLIARRPGVLAGLQIAGAVFHRLDPGIAFAAQVEDGARVGPNDLLARLEGPALPLLAGERTALNFVQRLSGVATLTRAFVDAVAGTGAQITDTRKTTPGFRLLEKYAVRQGGGVNHRFGLYDAVLIKENHAACAGGVAAAIAQVRQAAAQRPGNPPAIFVEAENLDEVRSLLPHAPDRILLDDMSLEQMREAVRLIRQSGAPIAIEATGGITLSNVRQAAETGVDLISIGALTHSAPALDLSLRFV